MTTETTPGPVTAEEHLAEARRFAAAAEERTSVFDRSADLQAAQVHATIAQTLVAEKMAPMMAALVESLEPATAKPEAPARESDEGSRP